MGGRGQSIGRGGSTPRPGARGTPSGYTLSDVQAMSLDEFVDFLDDIEKNITVDPGLNDVPFQKFLVALGIDEKPEVVSQNEFLNETDAGDKELLYRTVNSSDDMTADEMINQLISGDMAYAGNGVVGDGTYLSNSGFGSRDGYGLYSDANPSTQTVVTYLNDKARPVDILQINSEMRTSSNKDISSRLFWPTYKSQYAMYRGYNVIVAHDAGGEANEDYYNVLDRSVLTTAGTRVVPTQNNPNPRS